MDLENVLTRFETVLSEEQNAIREVETAALVRLAEEKDTLMSLLASGGIGAREDLRPRFKTLTEHMRRNLMLLIHAKACLRDVLEVAMDSPNTYQAASTVGAGTPTLAGGTVSVVG